MSQLVVVAWPEDGASDAPAVLEHLIRHALRAATGLARDRVRVDRPPVGTERLGIAGDWRSKKSMTELARAVVTRLALGHVALLHVDADASWPLLPTAAGHLEKLRRAIRHGHDDDNFVEMVPYTMIESWTYRKLAEAERLAHALDPTRCAATHALWTANPVLLDTTTHLKDLSPLKHHHHLALLASGWPRADAYADNRSFRRFADALAGCPAVIAAVRET